MRSVCFGYPRKMCADAEKQAGRLQAVEPRV